MTTETTSEKQTFEDEEQSGLKFAVEMQTIIAPNVVKVEVKVDLNAVIVHDEHEMLMSADMLGLVNSEEFERHDKEIDDGTFDVEAFKNKHAAALIAEFLKEGP